MYLRTPYRRKERIGKCRVRFNTLPVRFRGERRPSSKYTWRSNCKVNLFDFVNLIKVKLQYCVWNQRMRADIH